MANIRVDGLDAFKAGLDGLIARIDAATRVATGIGGHVIEANAKRQFEGNHPPGQPHIGGNKPNVASGTLYRSITLVPPMPEPLGLGIWRVSVAPTTKYGRRIELGFRGADSLGRRFNQPPYPFMQPGLEQAIPILSTVFSDAWARALSA